MNAVARFLFDGGSPRVAALFRIVFCAAILFARWANLADVELFYADTGLVPNEMLSEVQKQSRFWSVLHVVGSPAGVEAMYWLYAGLAAMVLFGCFTRPASVLLFVVAVSFRWRNPMITNSGDQVLICALFWLMFLDSGHSWSFDSWWRRHRGLAARAWNGCLAQRGLQFQLCLIYFGSTFYKLGDADWQRGDVMFYVAGLVYDWPVSWIALMDHPILYKGLTWGTLLWEFTFPVLAWFRRFRYVMVIVGLVFHGIIGTSMGLPFFSLHMTALLLLFLGNQKARHVVPS